MTTGTLDAAELTIQPSRASLPAATGPAGGTPSAAFEFGRWRVPVLWLFIPGALALVGLVVVIVWTSRAGRGEPGGR
ncbi:MAG: hypothetical protein O2843_03800 [Chloroflexi bacterium]|nr:hypothetical protein [Chloroflexota bacterium]